MSVAPGRYGQPGSGSQWGLRMKWRSSSKPSPNAITHNSITAEICDNQRALHHRGKLAPRLALRFGDRGVCNITLISIHTLFNRVALFTSLLKALVRKGKKV